MIYVAKHYGVSGYGVTLSRQQFERSKAHIAKEGLGERIQIAFKNYRSVNGSFDKIVSVGMMEHLPRREYPRYFSTIAEVLTPQGWALCT